MVDNTMRQVLMKDASEAAIAAAARQAGMSTLRLSGLTKARQGKTTYEEVIRVTQSDTEEVHSCPKCGRHVSEDMVACPYCATNLDRGHCQNCGKALEEDWNVCPYCRTAVTPP